MPDPELEWLVAELEHLLDLKTTTTKVQAQVDAAQALLDSLEATYRGYYSRLRGIEGSNEFVSGMDDLVSRKIAVTTAESQAVAQLAALTSLGSDYLRMHSRLRTLEHGLGIYLSQTN